MIETGVQWLEQEEAGRGEATPASAQSPASATDDRDRGCPSRVCGCPATAAQREEKRLVAARPHQAQNPPSGSLSPQRG